MAFEHLIAPGAPFELAVASTDKGPVQYFAKAPADLNTLFDMAHAHGDAEFIVERDRRLRYRDVMARADALAVHLGQLGITQGDRIGIAMRNRAEWIIGFIAIIRIGGIATLVNSRSAGNDMRDALEATGARIVLSDTQRSESLHAAGWDGTIIALDDDSPMLQGAGMRSPARSAPTPDAPACILFTSGTTGRAKGAVLTHRAVITGLFNGQMAGANAIRELAERHHLDEATLLAAHPPAAGLLVFPLFHVSGLISIFLSMLLQGGKIVIVHPWNAEVALQCIDAEGVTSLSGVPTMLWDVLNADAGRAGALNRLSVITTGGQGTPLNLVAEIGRIAPNAMVGTGYGMTETCGAVSLALGRSFLDRPSSSGQILPTVDARVVDDNGHAVGDDECGEIQVRGAMVMSGYWNQPQATEEAFAQGWLRTGDIGRLDEDGYIYIVDRKKDMIISGGENIYCAEVERIISIISGISEVAAFGLPDNRLGEKLAVAIVGSTAVSAERIQKHVTEHLGAYRAPAKIFIQQAPLPRNAAGKVDKIRLKKTLSNVLTANGE